MTSVCTKPHGRYCRRHCSRTLTAAKDLPQCEFKACSTMETEKKLRKSTAPTRKIAELNLGQRHAPLPFPLKRIQMASHFIVRYQDATKSTKNSMASFITIKPRTPLSVSTIRNPSSATLLVATRHIGIRTVWVCMCECFPTIAACQSAKRIYLLAYHLEKGHANGAPFSQSAGRKLETVEKPYVCPYKGCGKAYKNPNGLG